MGIGFLVTIVVLAAVLGLFAKQLTSDEQTGQADVHSDVSLEDYMTEPAGSSAKGHSHAI